MYIFEDTLEVLESRTFEKKIHHHMNLILKIRISLLELILLDSHGFHLRTRKLHKKNMRMLKEVSENIEKEMKEIEFEYGEKIGPSIQEFLNQKELRNEWERFARRNVGRIKRRRFPSIFKKIKRVKKKI